MIKTEFFKDFLNYYEKASHLQLRNRKLYVGRSIDDPLMEAVTIYDTVNRRYAGFSKALEDVHGTREAAFLKRYGTYNLDVKRFHFIHLFHRFTGSGASFQPTFLPDGTRNPNEHGYYNNHVEELCKEATIGNTPSGNFGIQYMRDYIVKNTKPMVTSVGNQPPSLKNGDPSKYRLAQQFYFDNYAEAFIDHYLAFLSLAPKGQPLGIKQGVDFACQWHKSHGFKQWHFVLTAFVMDTAEYYPELMDPNSHCYYGANCIKSFELMFTREKGDPKKNDYYEQCMAEICKAVQGRPYDVEDVCCDYIRYCKEYIPKGYEDLPPEKRKNNSILKVNGVYPKEIQDRINEVLG